jgi:hypothetical protein
MPTQIVENAFQASGAHAAHHHRLFSPHLFFIDF